VNITPVTPDEDANLRSFVDAEVEVLVEKLLLELFELHVELENRLFAHLTVKINVIPLNLDKRIVLARTLLLLLVHFQFRI
jgi:hypothetical protein